MLPLLQFAGVSLALGRMDPEQMMNGAYRIANQLPGKPAPTHRGQYIEVYSANITSVS